MECTFMHQVTLFLPLYVTECRPEMCFMDLSQCFTVLNYMIHQAQCNKQNSQWESWDTISEIMW